MPLLWRRRTLEQSFAVKELLSLFSRHSGERKQIGMKEGGDFLVTLRHSPFNTVGDTVAQVTTNPNPSKSSFLRFEIFFSFSFPFKGNFSIVSLPVTFSMRGEKRRETDSRALPQRTGHLRWSITYGIRDVLFQHYTVVREMGNKNTIQRVP